MKSLSLTLHLAFCLTLLGIQLSSVQVMAQKTHKRTLIHFTTSLLEEITEDKLRDSIQNLQGFREINFNEAKVECDFNFSRLEFQVPTFFQRTEFAEKVYFSNAEFKQVVDFQSTVFKKGVNFSQTIFPKGGLVSFARAVFNGKIEFKDVILPKTLDFTGADLGGIQGILDLTKCKLRDTTKNARPCKIILDGRVNTNRLLLDYTKFELAFPEGYQFQDKSPVYEGLLATLKKNGLQTSYQKYDIEYQELGLQEKGFWGRVFIFFQSIWWNYGYNKEWAVRNFVVLLLFFSLINWLFFDYMIEFIYSKENIIARHRKVREKLLINTPSHLYYKSRNNKFQWYYFFILIRHLRRIKKKNNELLPSQETPHIRELTRQPEYYYFKTPTSAITYTTGNVLLFLLRYWGTTLLLAIFYTGFIFFNIGFENKKFRFMERLWFIKNTYILIIRVVGVISIAYLIRFMTY